MTLAGSLAGAHRSGAQCGRHHVLRRSPKPASTSAILSQSSRLFLAHRVSRASDRQRCRQKFGRTRSAQSHRSCCTQGRQRVGNTPSPQAVQAVVLTGAFLLIYGGLAQSQAAPTSLHRPELFQLASEDSDFWVNVSRYGRYFVTVLLGTAYISVKPILEALKRPKTAFLVVAAVAALYLFVSTTVQAMLGVTNPLEYQPSGFFPDNY